MQKIAVAVLVILIPLAAGYYWRQHPTQVESIPRNPLTTPYVADPEALRTEAEGHLIIDSDLKHYFDFLLTSADSLDVIQVRAETAFGQTLQSDIAKQEAGQLWKAYIDYLRFFTQLDAHIPPADLQQNLQLLREKTLGKKEAPAFFADEIALEQTWMNPAAESDTLLTRMPGMGSLIFLLVQNQDYIKRFDANQADFEQYVKALQDQQIYDRYKQDNQAELNKRYMEYMAVRDKIMNWDMPEEQKSALLQDYLGRHFSQHELIKVKELDKAHGGMDH